MKKIIVSINAVCTIVIFFLLKHFFYFRKSWLRNTEGLRYEKSENLIRLLQDTNRQLLSWGLANLFAALLLVALSIFLWVIYLKYTQDDKPIIDLEKIKRERQARKKQKLQEKLDKMNGEDN